MTRVKEDIAYIEKNFRVIAKADVSGEVHLVPMVLWPTQRHFIENSGRRNIVLKSRQTGMSTGIMAKKAKALFTLPYQRQTIITHDQETSEFLFQTVQRFYHNLPKNARPTVGWRSGTRMSFPKTDSYIYIDSAKSDSLGIGHTLNDAHLSEFARWPPGKAEALFADISQTVPEGGCIDIESTPKGRVGKFYDLCIAAKKGDINYKYFFYPWWWDVTCTRKVEHKLELTNEEKQMVSQFGLREEQIAFRREKIGELGDLFFQEYPENDIDCWLSSDISVFDGVAIRRYLQELRDGKEEGNLTVWKDYLGSEKYVIGVDVAGGLARGDYTVASVVSVKRREYVARYRAKIPPDMFVAELLRLGKRYGDALIAVERAQQGHTVLRMLLDANYPNIYYHLDYDANLGAVAHEPGWKTSGKTKPDMISTMAATLRAHDLGSWSENLMNEASGLMWDGTVGGKTKKPARGYDDELDAVMITLQVIEQSPIIKEEERPAPVSYAPY